MRRVATVLLLTLLLGGMGFLTACASRGGGCGSACATGCKGCAPDRNCCEGCRQGTGCTCPR